MGYARTLLVVGLMLSMSDVARGQTPLLGAKHSGAVTAIAYSRDGKSIVTGGADNTIRVWDAATLKEVRQLAGHSNRITTVVFAVDGRSIASSSADGSICVWDAASGMQKSTMRGHRGSVRAIAVSSDGRALASGGEDFRLFIWDMTNGGLTRIFQGHRAGLTALSYAPDGKMLASAGGDSVRLWDAPTGRELHQFTVPQEGLHGLAFSADGKTLAAGGKEALYIWETATGKQLHKLGGHKAPITSVAFAPDGRVLASAAEDGVIFLWDPVSGKHLRAVGRHRGSANAIAFAPHSKHLVSGGEDQAVMIWDVSRRLAVPDKPIDLSAQELDGLWGDLAGADSSKAFSAMGTLVAGSRHALPFLHDRLKANPLDDDEKKITQYIKQLDDDNFAVREKASIELEKLGPAASLALKQAIVGDLSLEARRRAERIVERLKSPVLSPEQLRLQRAVEVLSTLDSPEARKVLEELSRGRPNDFLTLEAKSALELLNKRSLSLGPRLFPRPPARPAQPGTEGVEANMSDKQLVDVLHSQLDDLRAKGLYKRERLLESPQGSAIKVGGREVINFCANNYLGLANHPDIVEAAHEGLRQHGYGMASVRFICGTQDLHKQLETAVARFLHKDDAILYSSCFDANTGLFETILGEDDTLLSDELNHASIIDGIRLCKAKRFRYKHSDMAELERGLKEAATSRLRLIASDGVFSMDGDLARLNDICDLADRYQAAVMVDDSHATGILGVNGRGSVEELGVLERVDIITSTLGKALGGAAGGFTCARKEVVEFLRQRSRPYLFSNALPPVITRAALKAFELVAHGQELRERLHANAGRLRAGLEGAGFTIKPGRHPILPVMLGDAALATRMADRLLERGIYVIGFSFPVVPQGQARIRIQLSAAHTPAQLEQAIQAFTEVGRELGVVK